MIQQTVAIGNVAHLRVGAVRATVLFSKIIMKSYIFRAENGNVASLAGWEIPETYFRLSVARGALPS